MLVGIEGLTASLDDDTPDVKGSAADLDPTMMTVIDCARPLATRRR
jgi:hypothetical protein